MSEGFVNKAPANLKINIKTIKFNCYFFTLNQSKNFLIAPRT